MRALKGFHSISTLIQSNLDHYADPPARPEIQSALSRKWLQCAGRAAPFSYPLLFQSGRLVIFTQSPVWSTELRHQIQDIKLHLSDFNFGEVEIKVIPQRIAATKPEKVKRQISTRNKAVLSSSAERLSHTGLSEVMARLGKQQRQS